MEEEEKMGKKKGTGGGTAKPKIWTSKSSHSKCELCCVILDYKLTINVIPRSNISANVLISQH